MLLPADVGERRVRLRSGRVEDEHVDRSELARDRGDEPLGVARVGDVGRERAPRCRPRRGSPRRRARRARTGRSPRRRARRRRAARAISAPSPRELPVTRATRMPQPRPRGGAPRGPARACATRRTARRRIDEPEAPAGSTAERGGHRLGAEPHALGDPRGVGAEAADEPRAGRRPCTWRTVASVAGERLQLGGRGVVAPVGRAEQRRQLRVGAARAAARVAPDRVRAAPGGGARAQHEHVASRRRAARCGTGSARAARRRPSARRGSAGGAPATAGSRSSRAPPRARPRRRRSRRARAARRSAVTAIVRSSGPRARPSEDSGRRCPITVSNRKSRSSTGPPAQRAASGR